MGDPDSAAIGLVGAVMGLLAGGSAAPSILDAVALRFVPDLSAFDFDPDCCVGGTCESARD